MTAPEAPVIKVPSIGASRAESLASSRKKSLIVRYLAEYGWVHLLLIACIGIFLFPFAYMFATSMKTDDELSESGWLPTIPSFLRASPYVREVAQVVRPSEAPPEKWERVLPQFKQITEAAVDSAPISAGAASVDTDRYR